IRISLSGNVPPDSDSSCHVRRFSSHTVAMRSAMFVATVSCFIPLLVQADGPADNLPDKVRRIPPPGIKISEADRAEMENGVAALDKEIESLRGELKGKPMLLDLLSDV